ncbi:MAG: hypothetical protein M3R54_09160, partial [Chloroflexota bacterium]|nr:hypothetical protein [Chloroflexota bacterium]
EQAFTDAGLAPVGATFAVERDTTQVLRQGPATVNLGDRRVGESPGQPDVRSFIDADTGGGRVEAPVVFVGHGLSPADYPPRAASIFASGDLGTALVGFADGYSTVDVRGKIVILLRYRSVNGTQRDAHGPDAESSILNAKKRGAAAIVFVDPDLPKYPLTPTLRLANPYVRLEELSPVTDVGGVPVVLLSPKAADILLEPIGIRPSAMPDQIEATGDEARSTISRELGVRAVVDVPIARVSAHVRSLVAETPGLSDQQKRIVVWAVKRPGATHPVEPLLAALARQPIMRRSAFVFVLFDAAVAPSTNARQVAEVLGARPLALFLVLDAFEGAAVRFTTPFGDLIPALDLYADKAGASYVTTTFTVSQSSWTWPGAAPYIERPAVLITGDGGVGDRRADAAAIIGYLAARRALEAEELPR